MLKSKAGLSSLEEDMHKELKTSKVVCDNNNVHKLVDGIQQSLNPFSDEVFNLYNIATGKAASPVVMNNAKCHR